MLSLKDMKKEYRITFNALMNLDDIRAMNGSFYDFMNDFMSVPECWNLTMEIDHSDLQDNDKRWYTVTFNAMLSLKDVKALNSCFYESMNAGMTISDVANLSIIVPTKLNTK